MAQHLSTGYLTRQGKLQRFKSRLVTDMKHNYTLYLLVLPVIAYYIVFRYFPIGGIQIAFKDYKPALGIFGSPWTIHYGFGHFIDFVTNPYFERLLRNTVLISFYSLLFGFPAPIVLAIMLSELRGRKYKKVVQTLTYFPHFISTVVVCGIITQFALSDGLFNQIGQLFGAQPVSFLQKPEYFRTIYVGSGIWQGVGWSSIIYLAAIASVNSEVYEAAALDGAGRMRRIIHVTLPHIEPTIVLMLIMSVGNIMNVGSEKVLLLYNPSIYETADVISTYVYRRGLLEFNFSFSTAVNLMNSVINFLMVLGANAISRKVSETSLF
ncbi:MAG: ABC transporter permease subunit [Eubacteriales bacterium]|nr:ABC transporter permease subunit [Kiritimatiellia bacterium]MDD4744308.1 ABC transporter permease subunit [Eubacteriales bacterium]